jgi:hypothetical protein
MKKESATAGAVGEWIVIVPVIASIVMVAI